MASQKAFGRFSLKQLYDFIKVKGAQVVTDFNHDPAKNANSVILKLTEDGILLKPSGRATYSKIQLELVDFINSIPSQLLEVGKVKEFKLSEELLKELYQDEKFGVLFKNSYGDEIRIDANCKNITDYKKRPNKK